MSMDILYLCNGDKECSKSKSCHKNGGDCKHTNMVEHARNFKKEDGGLLSEIYYVEQNA